MEDARRERWEQGREWPLSAAAVVFLVAFSWPVLDPGLPAGVRGAFTAVTWAVWSLFAVDYTIRLVLSGNRKEFVLGHVFDLVVVVAPVLRPLHLLRVLALLGVLNRRAGAALHGRVIVYVLAATTLIVYVASIAMLQAERGRPGSSINSFSDALWWAMTTITTVGYGDEYPVTATGRFVAAALMVAGIALLGVVTASVAAWLVRRVAEEEVRVELATQADVRALHDEVVALREEIRRLGPPAAP